MALKTNDFVEIEYTGRIKEDNMVFDTTDEKTAKDNNIHNEKQSYGPVIICIGEKQVLPGIDEQMQGKEPEKSYTFEVTPEQAFGKKDAKLIQLINTNKFRKQGITPIPGLQINIDGMMGKVKTVTGGRTIVDFNHPLSGRDLIYDVKVNKRVTDDKKKLEEYLKLQLGQKDIKVTITEGNAKVELKTDIPKQIQEPLIKKITEIIPSVKKLEFVKAKEEKKSEALEESKEDNKESPKVEDKKESIEEKDKLQP